MSTHEVVTAHIYKDQYSSSVISEPQYFDIVRVN